jgi:hypothetical protein
VLVNLPTKIHEWSYREVVSPARFMTLHVCPAVLSESEINIRISASIRLLSSSSITGNAAEAVFEFGGLLV